MGRAIILAILATAGCTAPLLPESTDTSAAPMVDGAHLPGWRSGHAVRPPMDERAPMWNLWGSSTDKAIVLDCGEGHTATGMQCPDGTVFLTGRYGVCTTDGHETIYAQVACTL